MATGLSIKPKYNTEAGVFLFRGQNPLEKHFQELLQEQETGRSLGKPQASTSEAKGSAVPGAAPQPHHQISQGTWLLVLYFPKERNKSRNSLLRPCLHGRGSRGRNESEGDLISLSCPSSLCLKPSGQVFCDVCTPGWQTQGGTFHGWQLESASGNLHGPTGDGGFSFLCFTDFRKNAVSRTSCYPPIHHLCFHDDHCALIPVYPLLPDRQTD